MGGPLIWVVTEDAPLPHGRGDMAEGIYVRNVQSA